jgi:solute carrier family 25 protein 34/35
VEFVLGDIAAVGAGFFTNPLAVVKRVLQLQGELQELGRYEIHYRGLFHSFYLQKQMEFWCCTNVLSLRCHTECV